VHRLAWTRILRCWLTPLFSTDMRTSVARSIDPILLNLQSASASHVIESRLFDSFQTVDHADLRFREKTAMRNAEKRKCYEY